MQDRALKTRRIVSLQAQIKQLEEWKLGDLDRQIAEAEAMQRELLQALGDDHPLYGLFIDTMARRLRRLAEETTRTREIRDTQARRVLACASRLKGAERLAAIADRGAARETAKKELLDLVEAYTAYRDASLP